MLKAIQYITRKEAEGMYIKEEKERLLKILKDESKSLSNKELEDNLKERFTNYVITEYENTQTTTVI